MHPSGRSELSAATPASSRLSSANAWPLILCIFGMAAPVFAQTATGTAPPASDSTLPVPGTLPDQEEDGLSSLHGLPSNQTTILLDGSPVTQGFLSVPAGLGSDRSPDPDGDAESAQSMTGPSYGLSRGRRAGASYSFSQAAVRDLTRVATASYTAQTGNELFTVSRSGTDGFHGSAFFNLRSSALAASNPLAVATTYVNGAVSTQTVKPHDLRENYGGTLGGPVPRVARLFYFYTFDQQRRGFPAISTPSDPNFYALTNIQRALLRTRGLTAAQIDAGLTYVASLTGETPRRADQTIHFGKLDWHPRPRMAVSAQYNGVRWNSPAGLIDAPTVARGRASLGNANGGLDEGLIRIETTHRHLTNQLAVQFVHDLQYESPQANLPQEPPIGPGGLAPEVNIGPNGLLFGTPAFLSKSAYPDERRLTLANTLTYSRGHHLLTLGATVSFLHDLVATASNLAGTFRYDSGNTGGRAGGLVDFLTDYSFNVNTIPNGGCPSILAPNHLFCFRTYTQSFGQQATSLSTQVWAGFLDETWTPRPRLTIHAGLRYDYTLLPIPQNPNPTLDTVFGARGATSIFPEDRNNLGPRAAIAYEPFGPGRGTLHAGIGLFYGRLPGATISAALTDTALPQTTTRIRIVPSVITACPQVPSQGFGYPCSFLTQPTGTAATSTSAVVFDRRFRLPAIAQGSLSFERSFWRETNLSAGYLFHLARQLPSSTDLNIAPASGTATFQLQGGTGAPGVRDGEAFRIPVYSARITPAYGTVTDIRSSANSNYHGLILTAASHPASTLRVRATYTWSKTIDFAPNLSATPRANGQFDPFTAGYDKGLSTLDHPHVLNAAATWQPHPARLPRLTGGWFLTPNLLAHSGRPYSLDLFGGTRLPGGYESLNGSGGALYLPTVGRNTLRLPPTIHVDLAAGRNLNLRRNLHLHLQAEAYNLFNHRQVSSVTQRAYLIGDPVAGITPLVFQSAAAIAQEGLNTQPFGTPNASGTSLSRERQIQFSARLEF